jgi:amyloid beta precursor protein binding protein 1
VDVDVDHHQPTGTGTGTDTGGGLFDADSILAAVAQQVPGAEKHERVVQAAREVARAAGGELHNVAALTGGMVAQETIKIVTKQYIPVDNTCVYDGIGGRCQVLRL